MTLLQPGKRLCMLWLLALLELLLECSSTLELLFSLSLYSCMLNRWGSFSEIKRQIILIDILFSC